MEKTSDSILQVKNSPVENASDWVGLLLRQMRSRAVTVFGDFCIDAYWTLQAEAAELSLETGLEVRRVRSQRYSLGGAGSVLANLAALQVGTLRAIGMVGTDVFGEKLRSILEDCGVETAGLLADAAWETMVYAKPYFGER